MATLMKPRRIRTDGGRAVALVDIDRWRHSREAQGTNNERKCYVSRRLDASPELLRDHIEWSVPPVLL
jgi:hypothetical protein